MARSKKSTKFHLEFLSAAQKMAWGEFQLHDVLFLVGPAGVGKAQPLDSIVYTPTGPKLMGEIQIMDEVCTPDGALAEVIAIYPQGIKDIYKVSFADGDSVECCGDHLWLVDSMSGGWSDKLFTTDYLLKNYKTPAGRRKYAVKTPIVEFEKRDVLIDPYIMGVFLGEGGFTNANLVFSTADEEILQTVSASIKEDYICKQCHNPYDYRIVKKRRSGQPNIYKDELRKYGLWGLYAHQKHIPEDYLYNSFENRLALLQGLMDSDGTVGKNNSSCNLSTSSKKLADQFKDLANSLGGICKIRVKKNVKYSYKGKIKKGRDSYSCTVCFENNIKFFRLNRKLEIKKDRVRCFPKRIISDIKHVGKKQAQCITLNSEDGLYITNHFVVTHNSHLAIAFAINEVLQKKKRKIILTRPIVESGESLGYLPGDFHDKVNPYMLPLYDVMHKLLGANGAQRDAIDNAVEVAPLAYMRGRTFDNAVCIFDEAQNASKSQLKLFLSRFGENSKIIVTGDPLQSDLMTSNVPLVDVMRRLETVSGVGIINFKKDSIRRHPMVSAILERLEE